MTNSTRRGKIDPIWWAPVLVVIVVAISTLTALLFSGTLRSTVPLTLVSDRAGLVMENGAKVKLRGVADRRGRNHWRRHVPAWALTCRS